MDQEIFALSGSLNHPFWIDFSLASNQANIVTHYKSQDRQKALVFFQQLLLGVELYLRLRADLGGDARNNGDTLILTAASSMHGRPGPNMAFHRHRRTPGRRRAPSRAAALPFRVRILDILRQKQRFGLTRARTQMAHTRTKWTSPSLTSGIRT